MFLNVSCPINAVLASFDVLIFNIRLTGKLGCPPTCPTLSDEKPQETSINHLRLTPISSRCPL